MPDPESAPDDDKLDRLAGRLRSGALREQLARWRAARGGRALPGLQRWEVEDPHAIAQVEAEIGMEGTPVRLRMVRSGPDLPLLRALLLRTRDDGTGWDRASALRRPVHVYARLGLGAQGAQSFERLILPFSANGDRVDRAILLLAAEQDGRSLLEW